MFGIYSSSPKGDAVHLSPRSLTIVFEGVPDRESVERALTVTPSAGNPYFRWFQSPGRSAPWPTGPLPTPDGPLLTMRHAVEVLFKGTWAPGRRHVVRIAANTARAADGSALPRDHVFEFSTREDRIDVHAPRAARRAIVLSGGGAKGAFQVGALKYLYETEGFYPDVLVGVSVGAINAYKLAEDPRALAPSSNAAAQHRARFAQLEAFWGTLRENEQVYLSRPEMDQITHVDGLEDDLQDLLGLGMGAFANAAILGPMSIPLLLGFGIAAALEVDEIVDEIERKMKLVDRLRKAGSIYMVDPLVRDFLERHVDIGRVRGSRIDLQLGAVDLISGALRWFDKTDADLVSAVRASLVMPVFFPQEKRDNAVFTDGGIREVAGVARAIERGANDIVVIPTYRVNGWPGLEPRYRRGRFDDILEVGLRSVAELVFDEILGDDVEGVLREQRLLHRETGRDIRIRVVDPTHEMNSSLEFHPEAVRRFIKHGYDRAAHVLGGGPVAQVPHPVGPTRTSLRLVVVPTDATGAVVRDANAVRKPKPSNPNVRLVLRERGHVVQTYPSDLLFTYPQVVVPGSDPNLVTMPLDPDRPNEHQGEFYALPLHHGGKYDLEVLVSAFEGVPYKEFRSRAEIQFDPDSDGVGTIRVTLPMPQKTRTRSLGAMISAREPGKPPGIRLHGEGEIADLRLLTGFGESLPNDQAPLGRWEGTRDAQDMPPLRAARVYHAPHAGFVMTLFSEPGFQGQRLDVGATPRTREVGFEVRSVRWFRVRASGGG